MSGTLTSQEQATLDHQAFLQNSSLMQQIVREMKEIAELPSEVPKDRQGLQKVEFPENGGVHTFMDGYEEPYKGFPFHEFVDKIDVIKKVQRGVLSSMFHSLKSRPKWQVLCLALVPWLFTDMVSAFAYTFFRMVDRFKLKPIRYCTSIRELHRAMSIQWHTETPQQREMREMIRTLICMFLEFDNAYRFRFQDVIVELDKNNLKNPAKEIVRLLNLMSSRELTQEIKDTWRLVKYFLPVYLWFNPTLKKTIAGILLELDLQKLVLDKGDIEFCKKRVDYKFKHMV